MISVRAPPMSLGWTKKTSVPCAPMRGSPRMRAPLASNSALATWMSGTSKQTWCCPPSGFFSRNFTIGEFSPSGSISSIWLFGVSTKQTRTPCAGRSKGDPCGSAPNIARYISRLRLIDGVATPTWLRRPSFIFLPLPLAGEGRGEGLFSSRAMLGATCPHPPPLRGSSLSRKRAKDSVLDLHFCRDAVGDEARLVRAVVEVGDGGFVGWSDAP